MITIRGTHVDLYVEILQVESVFPNVNPDDGDVRQERILVGRGDNLELASGRVKALMTQNQFQILKRPPYAVGWDARANPSPSLGYPQWSC